jgi:hypothetical protein
MTKPNPPRWRQLPLGLSLRLIKLFLFNDRPLDWDYYGKGEHKKLILKMLPYYILDPVAYTCHVP